MEPIDPSQDRFYRERAPDYHALVEAEDCDGRLLPALRTRMDLAGRRVVEVGAGTGRLTRLLAEAGATVIALEPVDAMRAVAEAHLGGLPAVDLRPGDARALPLDDASADAHVAGWVFGHFRLWMPEGWRQQIGLALSEARRVVRRGGTLAVLETLGTGTDEPGPPSRELAAYYRWLEERGFRRDVIRTDYAFPSPQRAAEVLGPFFGEALRERVMEAEWSRVPEWTGLWTAPVR